MLLVSDYSYTSNIIFYLSIELEASRLRTHTILDFTWHVYILRKTFQCSWQTTECKIRVARTLDVVSPDFGHNKRALTWKGNMGMSGGQGPHFTPLWHFIRPSCIFSSSEDPSFLKFLIFYPPKWQIVFVFRHSKSPFSSKFQLFSSKQFFKIAAL